MKICANLIILLLSIYSLKAELTNIWSYKMSQYMSKDIFELNGIPYMKPMVEAVNATSNSRFFNQAFIPEKVDKPYFRIGLNMMLGFVREDMKVYKPLFPTEPLDPNKLSKYGTIDIFTGKVTVGDTAGLIYYLFKTILYDGAYGNHKGALPVPDSAATILGNIPSNLQLNTDTLKYITSQQFWYNFLPQDIKDSINNVLTYLPKYITLPQGGNLNTIIAGIPQIEIGSLWGTEALIRLIPPIDMGTEIGKFAFWGFGLKHSISQHFDNFPMDLAIQVVYQGTYLNNKVGVTQSELNANTTIWNFNINASRSIKGWFDIYSGLSFEKINILAKFKYYLPVEIQGQLGLLQTYRDSNDVWHVIPYPTPGYPGDQNPQMSNVEIGDFNYKWVIGITKQIGPIAIYVDYNISKFNIFSFGIEYRLFDIKREDYGNYY